MALGIILREIAKAVAISAGVEVVQKKVMPAVEKKLKKMRSEAEEQEPEEIIDIEEVDDETGEVKSKKAKARRIKWK